MHTPTHPHTHTATLATRASPRTYDRSTAVLKKLKPTLSRVQFLYIEILVFALQCFTGNFKLTFQSTDRVNQLKLAIKPFK
jgi:hypothetical protein